jgi:hypothetical protein
MGLLLNSGFAKRVVREDGLHYEITKAGSRFLKKYQKVAPSPTEEVADPPALTEPRLVKKQAESPDEIR